MTTTTPASSKKAFTYRHMCGLNPPRDPQAQQVPFGDIIKLRHLSDRKGVFTLCPVFGVLKSSFISLYPSLRNLTRCYATIKSARSAVLTGKAAACVLGIPFLGNTTELKTVDLTLPGNMKPPARSQRSPYATYSSRLLPARNILEENNIRVTDIPRTFTDLAYESAEMAVSFIEAAFNLKRASKAWVKHEITQMPALKHKTNALELLATTKENSESLYETKARRMIEQACLECVETIETQVEVTFDNITYRIDILLNGYLGIEIDGRCKTRNNPQALVSERIREKRIQNQGFLIIRYHPDELNENFLVDIVNILTRHKQKLLRT